MRSYDQYCGIAKALDVLGARWTPLLLRELLLGPRRYSELQRALPGITTNLLAARIRELQSDGILQQVRRDADGRRAWALTTVGEAVRPVLLALGAFGARWMQAPGDDHVNARWYVVSLQRRYQGGVAACTVDLQIDDGAYTLLVTEHDLVSRDGSPAEADLVIRGSLGAVVGLFSGVGEPPEHLEISGDGALLEGLRAALAAAPPSDDRQEGAELTTGAPT